MLTSWRKLPNGWRRTYSGSGAAAFAARYLREAIRQGYDARLTIDNGTATIEVKR